MTERSFWQAAETTKDHQVMLSLPRTLLRKPQDRRQRQLPLPARNERGEGWGEGCLNAAWNVVCKQDGPPLPSPLLPRRGEREKPCALSKCSASCGLLSEQRLRAILKRYG